MTIEHVFKHLGGSLLLWILVILAVLIDLWDGVHTAKVLGLKLHSHRLRFTVRKIGEYWRFIFMGFIADTVGLLFPFWVWPYLSILICLAIIGIETRSIYEHSRKRKDQVQQIPAMIERIISCATEKEALKMIKEMKKMLDDSSAKFKEAEPEHIL